MCRADYGNQTATYLKKIISLAAWELTFTCKIGNKLRIL